MATKSTYKCSGCGYEYGRLCPACMSQNLRIWDGHTCPKCGGRMTKLNRTFAVENRDLNYKG